MTAIERFLRTQVAGVASLRIEYDPEIGEFVAGVSRQDSDGRVVLIADGNGDTVADAIDNCDAALEIEARNDRVR